MKSINYFNFLAMALALFSLIAPSFQEGQAGDEEVKRNTHNILRFGRSGLNSPMNIVGRASGHNIMRFGRSMPMAADNSGQSESDSGLLASLWGMTGSTSRDTSALMDQGDNNEGQQMIPPIALYVSSSTSSFPSLPDSSSLSSPVGPTSAELKSSSSNNAVEETSSSSSSDLPSLPSSPALRSVSKRKPQSLTSRLLLPHLFLSSLYTPYPRIGGYPFNKKADIRDRNNFIHFG